MSTIPDRRTKSVAIVDPCTYRQRRLDVTLRIHKIHSTSMHKTPSSIACNSGKYATANMNHNTPTHQLHKPFTNTWSTLDQHLCDKFSRVPLIFLSAQANVGYIDYNPHMPPTLTQPISNPSPGPSKNQKRN